MYHCLKKGYELSRKCAVAPLWGHVLPLLPIALSRLKHSRCPFLRGLWLAQAWEEGWPDGSWRWPLAEELGDWPPQGVSHHLACSEHTSPQSPSSAPLSSISRARSVSWSLPSLSCFSCPFSSLMSHIMDGSGHLLLLPSTFLYPPLVSCPRLCLGNHLLPHS